MFLCFVAVGITLGALFYGLGSAYLVLTALPAAGLVLGIVSIAYSRTDFDGEEVSAKS